MLLVDERCFQPDLVGADRIVPVASVAASRDLEASSSTQRAATQIAAATNLHQHRPSGICRVVSAGTWRAGRFEDRQAGDRDPNRRRRAIIFRSLALCVWRVDPAPNDPGLLAAKGAGSLGGGRALMRTLSQGSPGLAKKKPPPGRGDGFPPFCVTPPPKKRSPRDAGRLRVNRK